LLAYFGKRKTDLIRIYVDLTRHPRTKTINHSKIIFHLFKKKKKDNFSQTQLGAACSIVQGRD